MCTLTDEEKNDILNLIKEGCVDKGKYEKLNLTKDNWNSFAKSKLMLCYTQKDNLFIPMLRYAGFLIQDRNFLRAIFFLEQSFSLDQYTDEQRSFLRDRMNFVLNHEIFNTPNEIEGFLMLDDFEKFIHDHKIEMTKEEMLLKISFAEKFHLCDVYETIVLGSYLFFSANNDGEYYLPESVRHLSSHPLILMISEKINFIPDAIFNILFQFSDEVSTDIDQSSTSCSYGDIVASRN